jgi:hypothetical protein
MDLADALTIAGEAADSVLLGPACCVDRTGARDAMEGMAEMPLICMVAHSDLKPTRSSV